MFHSSKKNRAYILKLGGVVTKKQKTLQFKSYNLFAYFI